MQFDTLEVTDRGDGIVEVAFDRPDVHNSQSVELLEEFSAALEAVESREDTRVVVLSGNGPSFSAGHDLDPERLERDWTVEERLEHEREHYYEYSLQLRNLAVPTIAQVHGICSAAGVMLMAMCDLAVASHDATFANPVHRMAGNGVELLVEPWDVGFRKAKELLWTGDSITGAEAAEIGMVNRSVEASDLEAEVTELATKIARMPPFAIQLSKRSFLFAQDEAGQQATFRHHMMAHQLSHASREWKEWHERGSEIIEEEGLSGWLRYRDEPFDL